MDGFVDSGISQHDTCVDFYHNDVIPIQLGAKTL